MAVLRVRVLQAAVWQCGRLIGRLHAWAHVWVSLWMPYSVRPDRVSDYHFCMVDAPSPCVFLGSGAFLCPVQQPGR